MQGLVDGPVSPEGSGKAHKPNKRRQVSKVSMTEATRVGTWGVPNEDNRPERAQQEDDPHGLQKHGPDRTSKQNDPLGLLTNRPEMANKQGTPQGTLTFKGSQPIHDERVETMSLSGAHGGHCPSMSILDLVCGGLEGHPARRLSRNHEPRPHKAQAKGQPQSQRHKMMFQGIIMLLCILALACVHISTIRPCRTYLAMETRNHPIDTRLQWVIMGETNTSGQRPHVREQRGGPPIQRKCSNKDADINNKQQHANTTCTRHKC